MRLVWFHVIGGMFECLFIIIEREHDKTNKIKRAPSEDSDQPVHLSSLIRVFAVQYMGGLGRKPFSGGQRRLSSDWAVKQYFRQ